MKEWRPLLQISSEEHIDRWCNSLEVRLKTPWQSLPEEVQAGEQSVIQADSLAVGYFPPHKLCNNVA
jgi:hypothetical protein